MSLPAVLLTLHSLAIFPLVHSTVTLKQIEPAQGFAYKSALLPRTYPSPTEPAMLVEEDGKRMPLPNMPGWGTVATGGLGRFHFSGDVLYFSATDNSDPRINGRTYTVRQPAPVPKRLAQSSWLLAVVGTLVVFVWGFSSVRDFVRKPRFVAPALLLIALVLANRAWFFFDYPIVAIHPDSGSYYLVAEQLGTATLPNFGNRPPVYPLFLKAVFSVVDRAIALAVAQSALSLLGSLMLVYGVFLWRPVLSLPAAGLMALYLFGFYAMEHDTAMLSESLYTSWLMFSFAGLIVGLRNERARWLGLASTTMALAILTRPAGMFLLVTYVLVAGWLIWRRFKWRATVAFLIPLPMLMISISVYNLHVVKVFAPTTWGEANLAVATFTYWETDPSYPPDINKDIERVQAVIRERLETAHKDRTVLDRTWNPLELGAIYVEGFYGPALDIAQVMGGEYETIGRFWIRRIASDSIRKHPDYYVKFVYAMLHHYYKPAPDYDFRVYLQNRSWLIYVQRHFSPERGNAFMVRLGKEFATSAPPPSLVITNFDPNTRVDLGERVIATPTTGWRIYELTHILRKRLFEYWAWSASVLAGLIASVIFLLRSRMRDDVAFVLFIVSASAVGASLVVSLVEFSQPRYSYPMEWAYGICALLLVLVVFFRQRPPDRIDSFHI